MASRSREDCPPALSGDSFEIDDPKAGRIRVYATTHVDAGDHGERPLLLVHSVNAAASAFEVRPVYDHYRSSRPTYALDLPGFGLSERSARDYTPRLMTDAIHAVVRTIRERHGEAPIDALALSLGCELLARAATEDAGAFRSLALVSPTGFNGTRARHGAKGSTREVPGLHSVLSWSAWDQALFSNLTRPGVIRFFLEKTWGGRTIDEELWAYDVLAVKAPGARHAPLAFLSGKLFSNDVTSLYEALDVPVWMSHGVRGDFVDYRGAEAMKSRPNWRITPFQACAMPYFELREDFIAAYDRFLASTA